MLVKKLDDLIGTDREVHGKTWTSRRLLLASEGRGYSLHDTVLYAGTKTEMEYVNHIESVYCIDGSGTLHDLAKGEQYPLAPGTLYVLDEHDRHRIDAESDLRVICVFTPPVTGKEVHDEHGAYPLIIEETE